MSKSDTFGHFRTVWATSVEPRRHKASDAFSAILSILSEVSGGQATILAKKDVNARNWGKLRYVAAKLRFYPVIL